MVTLMLAMSLGVYGYCFNRNSNFPIDLGVRTVLFMSVSYFFFISLSLGILSGLAVSSSFLFGSLLGLAHEN
jgi:hypothetical protein